MTTANIGEAMAKRDVQSKQTIVSVGAVVFKGDEVLLIRRGKPPFEGEWSIPGGRLDFGEALEAAARREVLEETGVRIRDVRQFATFEAMPSAGQDRHIVMVDFVAQWESGRPIAGDDALEAAFATFDDAVGRVSWATTKRALTLAREILLRAP